MKRPGAEPGPKSCFELLLRRAALQFLQFVLDFEFSSLELCNCQIVGAEMGQVKSESCCKFRLARLMTA